MRKLLQGTASLEFWATYDNSEIYPILAQANNVVRDVLAAGRLFQVPAEVDDADEVVATGPAPLSKNRQRKQWRQVRSWTKLLADNDDMSDARLNVSTRFLQIAAHGQRSGRVPRTVVGTAFVMIPR